MNKTIIWIIVIIVVLGGIYFFFLSPASQPSPVSTVQTEQPSNQSPTAPTSSVSVPPAPVQSVVKMYTVSIVNFSFSPSALAINKGDSVTWINNDSAPHQIAGAGLAGQVMGNGQSYTHVFTDAGTVSYHCAIHPSMTGTITVK